MSKPKVIAGIRRTVAPRSKFGDERDWWTPAAGLTLREAMVYYGDPHDSKWVLTLEAEGYGGPPPMLNVSGWPDEETDRDFRTKSFSLQRYRRYLEQALLGKLSSGELFATGYAQGSPLDQGASSIASDRWRILTPNFEISGATSDSGNVIGILVFSPSTSQNGTDQSRRFAASSLRTWYRHYVEKAQRSGAMPSRDDDWAAAKAEFGTNIPREALRAIRREIAPPQWRRFGRRKQKR